LRREHSGESVRTPLMKRIVQSALSVFGLRLARLNSNASPAVSLGSFFALLKRNGFDPKHVVDVGANHGNWTREAVKYFPSADYTLVEPQDELKIHVQDLIDRGVHIHWVNAGASDRSGVLTLYVDPRDCSSTFLQTPRTVKVAIRRVEVPVTTLNEIVTSSPLPIPNMVKIDAEGFDLKVISGASDLLGKTDVFLAEVAVGQRDLENTALMVVQKMADAGYRFIDVTYVDRSPKSGVLWLSEFAFLRNSSSLLDAAANYD
jgi:FkbM family methyltransferase